MTPIRQNTISVDYLNACLSYDPDSGILTWRRRPVEHFARDKDWAAWNKKWAGREAGCIRPQGRTFYRIIKVGSIACKAHQIAYAIYHGEWPCLGIDHWDGNGLHNNVSNLRPATHAVNSCNGKMQINNTTGATGVIFHKQRGRFVAQISISGKTRHIGLFDTIEAASEAYEKKKMQLGYTGRHGRPA